MRCMETPSTSTCASSAPNPAMAERTSPIGRSAQPAKSLADAGPWLWKYRRVSVASASSRVGRFGVGTQSSSKVKVCSPETCGPITVTPIWGGVPEVVVPALAKTVQTGGREDLQAFGTGGDASANKRNGQGVGGPPNVCFVDAEEFPTALDAAHHPGPARSSIKCASAGGTKWMVPRIGQGAHDTPIQYRLIDVGLRHAGQPDPEGPVPAGDVLGLHGAEPLDDVTRRGRSVTTRRCRAQ